MHVSDYRAFNLLQPMAWVMNELILEFGRPSPRQQELLAQRLELPAYGGLVEDAMKKRFKNNGRRNGCKIAGLLRGRRGVSA